MAVEQHPGVERQSGGRRVGRRGAGAGSPRRALSRRRTRRGRARRDGDPARRASAARVMRSDDGELRGARSCDATASKLRARPCGEPAAARTPEGRPESCVGLSDRGRRPARYTPPVPPRVARRGLPGPPRPGDPEVACPRSARSARCATAPSVVPDLDVVVAPPYDVISPALRAELAARDPRNVVRDRPARCDAGATDPDEKYRQAGPALRAPGAPRACSARTASRRSTSTSRSSRCPARRPGGSSAGFYGRLRLEPFGPGGGRPAARADAVRAEGGPLQAHARDRRQPLRASWSLYADPSGDGRPDLSPRRPRTPPAADVDRRRRRPSPALDRAGGRAADRDARRRPAGRGGGRSRSRSPTATTATRRRSATATSVRRTSPDEETRRFDFVLDAASWRRRPSTPPVVLPTHRVVRSVPAAGELVAAARRRASSTSSRPIARRPPGGLRTGRGRTAAGAGRIGLWTRDGGAILDARREAFEPLLPDGGEAAATARRDPAGRRPRAAVRDRPRGHHEPAAGSPTRSTPRRRSPGSTRASRRRPTPRSCSRPPASAEIAAVAREGDVMPQKSTYFYPKPLTGLVINPLEW